MKNLSQKLKTTLRSRRGEILIESIVSFIILEIILIGITAMTAASLRMIANANSKERERQEKINEAVLEDIDFDPSGETITFETAGFPPVISVKITIERSDDEENGFDVFRPKTP